MRGVEEDDLETTINEFRPRLGMIRRPEAISVLWKFIPRFDSTDKSIRYGVFKLFELLAHACHRNQVILSTCGFVDFLLSHFLEARTDATQFSDKEKHVVQKLLKRLLDMGTTTSAARILFQRAIKDDESLDAEVLDIIRAGMKSRWLEHLSLESPASLAMTQEAVKGLPATGFSLTVRLPI